MPEPRLAPALLQNRRRRRRLLGSGLLFAALILLGLTWSEALESHPENLSQRLGSGVHLQLQRLTNTLLGPVRVGIQIGHANAEDHPDELAALRVSTGGHAGDIYEVELNRDVAEELKERLERYGIKVDLLPATPPPGYHADLLISIHADSNPDSSRRGYKSAHFQPARNPLEPLLKAHLDRAYLAHSGLPNDSENISGSMNYYYAFNFRRFEHSIHPGTPSVIVELGYISNPKDWRYLRDADNPAEALERGIVSYLQARGRLLKPDLLQAENHRER